MEYKKNYNRIIKRFQEYNLTPLFTEEQYKGVNFLYKFKCNKCGKEFEKTLKKPIRSGCIICKRQNKLLELYSKSNITPLFTEKQYKEIISNIPYVYLKNILYKFKCNICGAEFERKEFRNRGGRIICISCKEKSKFFNVSLPKVCKKYNVSSLFTEEQYKISNKSCFFKFKCNSCGREFESKIPHSRQLPYWSLQGIICSCKLPFPTRCNKNRGRPMSEYQRISISEGMKMWHSNGGRRNRTSVNPLGMLIRGLTEYYKWRKEIYKKYNYSCVQCGSTEKLNAHHTDKSFNQILSEFLKEYNQFSPIEEKEILARLAINYKPFWEATGQALCETCHKIIERNKLENTSKTAKISTTF